MGNWNYDLSEAPRSVYRTEQKKIGKTVKDVAILEHKYIIATDGVIVTRSYYIPEQDRWCFFANGQTPLAWQPWPDAPEVKQ